MELVREGQAIRSYNEAGEKIAEITFPVTVDANVVDANHTFVSPELRGQGAAGQLLDRLVEEMDKEGKKIKATCPYVVRKFEEEPEKYNHINVDAK